jgi:hypothetical protein
MSYQQQNCRVDIEVKHISLKDRRQFYFNLFNTAKTVFSVETEKIFFIVGAYKSDNCQYYGSGYIVFTDHHTLYFSMNSNNKQEVIDKCLLVSRMIAHAYKGILNIKKY